jgi:transposase
MEKIVPNNRIKAYLLGKSSSVRKQYLAIIRFYLDGWSAQKVADEFGYTVSTVYTIARDFKNKLAQDDGDPFFAEIRPGRKKLEREGKTADIVVAYRKRNMSVPDIKSLMDARDIDISERTITAILKERGFTRLPRRVKSIREETLSQSVGALLQAPKSWRIDKGDEEFTSQLAGIMCFLPIIRGYEIDTLIRKSAYPKTQQIGRLQSILCFLALKLSNFERYSMDDAWCMDRGMGMFAGLNVLPKTAWFSSYSSAVTREMNAGFLKGLNVIWAEHGLLSDTVNLDFTAIPYWGDDDALENNWSGKRSKALASLQAVIAQDPDNGILCYGDTTIRHENQNEVVLEFLDFYHSDPEINRQAKYLVFDSKFTIYENLTKVDGQGIKFITIQRRSKNLEARIASLPKERWTDIRIEKANNKHRVVTVAEETTLLPKYNKNIRQIFIKGGNRVKPAVIITNDFVLPLEKIVRKYASRWMVEKEISEQIYFFHLNRNSSGIVVKADFDLTMTILAHNLYRILAMRFDGYAHCEANTIFDKFIYNAGDIIVTDEQVTVKLKRKRTLPLILEAMKRDAELDYPWLRGKKLLIEAATRT